MRIHKTCGTLSIYSFYQIIDTDDLRYLLKDFDEENPLKITEKQQLQLNTIWDTILHEYAELTFDKEVMINLKAQARIIKLDFRYNTAIKILKLYGDYNELKVMKLFKDINIHFDMKGKVEPQIQRILGTIKGLKMQAKIATKNYELRFKKVKKKIKVNLDKQALILEINLGLKSAIIARETSVTRWVTMSQLNEVKLKSYA